MICIAPYRIKIIVRSNQRVMVSHTILVMSESSMQC